MTIAQALVVEDLQNEIVLRDKKILYLEEQLGWLKRQIFGKRSERVIANLNEQQLDLEGFESQETSSQQTQTVPAHSRRKPNRSGQDKITLRWRRRPQSSLSDL